MKTFMHRAGFAAAPLAALALASLPGLASAQYIIYSGGNYYGSYAPSGYGAYGSMPEEYGYGQEPEELPYQYSYGYPSSSYSYSYPYGSQSQSQYQYQSQYGASYGYEYPYSSSYPSSYGYSSPSYGYSSSPLSYGSECSPYVGGVCGQDQYIGLGAAIYQGLIY